MVYYKVRRDANVYRSRRRVYPLIENELITVKELERLGIEINPTVLERVEIPKTKIYWFFGARFEDK